MDTLNDSSAQSTWLEISVFVLSVVFVFTVFNHIVLGDDEENPVSFKVPVPEQCSSEWKGEVLEKPTIKVHPFDIVVSKLSKSHSSQDRAPYDAIAQPMADYSGL